MLPQPKNSLDTAKFTGSYILGIFRIPIDQRGKLTSIVLSFNLLRIIDVLLLSYLFRAVAMVVISPKMVSMVGGRSHEFWVLWAKSPAYW